MKPLRYAVVGLGHGMEHVEAIMDHPELELAACCDLNETSFRRDPIPQDIFFTKDVREIAAMEDLDAVIIALPTALHKDVSIMMLEAGKHVLCEKPLAPTMEDCLKIKEAADKNDKIFQLGYEVRYSPFNQKMLQVCRSGEIGQVTNVWWNMFCDSKNTGWRQDRKLRGGKIFDCGCHYYNLLETWAGARAKRICVFGHELGKTGATADLIPETAIIMFEYENGVRGVFNLSDKCPNMQSSTCGVAGTNGKIEADPYYPDFAGSLNVHANGGQFRYQLDIKNISRKKMLHLGFREQHEAFLNSIRNGAKVDVGVDEGVCVNKILDAIDESLATGQVVNL